MTSLIQNPIPLFFDTAGSPLSDGFIYFGVTGQNPETSPITVYWDYANTQPAAQPIRTINGQPARNGTPAMVYLAIANCSMTVKDKSGKLVFFTSDTTSVPAMSAPSGSSLIGFIQSGVGAGPRTLQDKNREVVSVTDFYANGVSGPLVDPTGVVDSTLGIQAAVNTGKVVIAPRGSIFKTSAPIAGSNVWFDGQGSEIRVYGGGDGFQVSGACNFKDLTIKAQSNPNSTTNKGITGAIYTSEFKNVYVAFFNVGFDFATNSYLLKADNCTAYDCVVGFRNYSSTTSATTTVFDRCYALACGIGYYIYGVSDGELRNCAIDIGNAADYPITNTYGIYAQYCGSLNFTTTHIEGNPNADGFVCFGSTYNSVVNIIGGNIDLYINAFTSILFDLMGTSTPYSRVNISGVRQTVKATQPTNIRYRMRTDNAANKLYVHALDNSFISTNATIRIGNYGSGNAGESWITENNSIGQVPDLYLLTGSNSGVLQNIASLQASKISSASNSNQTLTAATPVPMFNVPLGFTLLYVWISSSGANYQSIYALKSDGVTAVAAAISAGANLTVTIVGSSPPVANITCPSNGTCQWAYQVISS